MLPAEPGGGMEELVATAREVLGGSVRADAGGRSAPTCGAAPPVMPAVRLGLGAAVSLVSVLIWPVLAPVLASTLGVSQAWSLDVLVLAGLVLGAPWAPRAARRFGRRAVTAAGATGSLALALTGLAGGFWTLAGAAVLAGAAAGLGIGAQLSCLADLYPAGTRPRAFGTYLAVASAAMAGAAGLFSVGSGSSGPTWRLVVLLAAGAAALATGATATLDDPDQGGFVGLTARLREQAGGLGPQPGRRPEVGGPLSEAERYRRVLATWSARPMLYAIGLAGFTIVPLPTYFTTFVQQHFNLVPPRAGLLLATVLVVGAVVPVVLSRLERHTFTSSVSPSGLGPVARRGARAAMAAAVVLAIAGLSPDATVAVILFGLVAGGLLTSMAYCGAALVSVVPEGCCPQAGVLAMASVLVGGISERQLMDSVSSRFGIGWSLAVLAVLALATAEWVRRQAPTLDGDLDALIERVVERAELELAHSHGHHLPLLRCRGLDYSYGRLQVLFDVNFSVEEAELVALLGTNGAGKSTLLRAISGIGFPQRGAIVYQGTDITFLPADRRVRSGISQLPGGRAVFGPLSVIDNLRVFGYSLARDRRQVEAGIEASFAAFPQLAARRHLAASSLSGGEQQMLALTRALLLRPRLLLIDELSLGLAPVVVAQLLEMVRGINRAGTAVVLVEQSVNIALSLVDRAYFMERGTVRFEGPAEGLLDRPDLVRAVFLDGVTGR